MGNLTIYNSRSSCLICNFSKNDYMKENPVGTHAYFVDKHMRQTTGRISFFELPILLPRTW